MKEQLINFETAQIAKSKGFNIETMDYYNKFKVLNNGSPRPSNLPLNWNASSYEDTSAPTQSLLQKWLRETHNIHIGVWYSKADGKYNSHSYHATEGERESEVSYLGTYEEALERGLQDALNLIED